MTADNVYRFPGGEPEPTEDTEARHDEVAVIEPSDVQLAVPRNLAPRQVVTYRLGRPSWHGVKVKTRRGLVALLHRLAYELVKGVWLRAWTLVRWFVIGVRHSDGFFAWVFATAERGTSARPSSASAGTRSAPVPAWTG